MENVNHNLKSNEFQFGANLNEELKKIQDNTQEIISLNNPLPSYEVLIKDPANVLMAEEVYDWKLYVDSSHNLIIAKKTVSGWVITDTNEF